MVSDGEAASASPFAMCDGLIRLPDMSTVPPDLPRPFYDEWSRRLRPAARALWNWHSALADPQPTGTSDPDASVESFFDEERVRAESGDPLRLVDEEVWSSAYEACRTHDLDRELLGAQVDAARVLYGGTEFETASARERFVRLWAVPHARLLARLAGADFSTQIHWTDELARGFFHLGRLVHLPWDVRAGRLFIPLEDLQQAGATTDQLQAGVVDESVQQVLWKESVRIRDAFAQGRPLIEDLSLRQRFALKRYWLGGLELLNELERRDFDLWSEPLILSAVRRLQVYVQTIFGRTQLR